MANGGTTSLCNSNLATTGDAVEVRLPNGRTAKGFIVCDEGKAGGLPLGVYYLNPYNRLIEGTWLSRESVIRIIHRGILQELDMLLKD